VPRLRRPRLVWAAGVAAASGYLLGRRRKAAAAALDTPAPSVPSSSHAGDVSPATSEANRIDALAKLKGLRDEGVLTEEQYESERQRLTQGIR
jgi:hypothetical protein